jgi:hypothetical protein
MIFDDCWYKILGAVRDLKKLKTFSESVNLCKTAGTKNMYRLSLVNIV